MTTTAALQALIEAALNQPGDTAIFAIWEEAGHYSALFDEQVRLQSAREVVSTVLNGLQDWLKSPQARAALSAAQDATAEEEAPRRPVEKLEPGSDIHLCLLGAPWHFNMLRGKEFADVMAFGRAVWDAARASQPTPAQDAAATVPRADFEEMERRKDGAYEERNRVVAALAKCFPSGVARTAIEGWSEDWHGCVYIDLPTGQVSWHFHDSQAHLFADLPAYTKAWDGHDTPEKYRRVSALLATPPAPQAAPTAAQPVAGQVQAVPELRERLDMAHDASLDDDHRGCRAILMEIIRMLDAAPTAPQAPALVPLTDHHKLDNDQQVFFYEQDFYVLSNFSSFNLEWQGLTFPTSEHAYHWEKFNIDGAAQAECRKVFLTARSAHDAFKAATELKQYRRADWDDVKVGIMRDILRAKAQQHEYVRRKLLATGDRELIEDSWRDDYWGWGPNRDGQNMLGKLWMEVRAGLRGITPAGTTPKGQQ